MSFFIFSFIYHPIFILPSLELAHKMKISQKIKQRTREDKIWWSFEYFPPRTAQVRLGGCFSSLPSKTDT